MLSNLGVKRVNNTKVKVAFSRKEEREKARQNQKTRPFIGLKNNELRTVTDTFVKQFKRDIL